MTLDGTAADWPKLGEILKNFGSSEGLRVFNTGTNYPGYVRTFEVHICSADGLHLSVDDRVYGDQQFNHDLGTIRVVFRTYDGNFAWQPLADRLSEQLDEEWPGRVSTDLSHVAMSKLYRTASEAANPLHDSLGSPPNKSLQTDASKCHAPCIRKGHATLPRR